MLCGGCETAKPTCKMQRQWGMPTSWPGCAELWPPQHRSCHREQHPHWSQMRLRVIEEWCEWWDNLAQCGGEISVVPFVHMFYSSPSSYLWEDDSGVVHTIRQGEGGEQGDAHSCFAWHAALQEVQARLRPNELLFAYLDDVYVVSKPDGVGAICTVLQEALWTHARMGSQKSPTRGHRCGAVPRSFPRHQSSGDSTGPPTMWQHIWRRCGGNMTCC